MLTFDDAIKRMPLIAILRGVQPDKIVVLADILKQTGFTCLEVPLNSPSPYQSIENLMQVYGERASLLIGAGTVTNLGAVRAVAKTGAKLLVMPHCNTVMIREAKRLKLICIPGVATPTEAYQAIDSGADGLKLFPSEGISPAVLKSIKTILPKDIKLFPVGGITMENMPAYWQVGVSGFGLGSALYQPGEQPASLKARAEKFIAVIKQCKNFN